MAKRIPWAGSTGSGRTGTAAWQLLRKQVLERDRHECQIRLPHRCIGIATTVDHVVRPAHGGRDDEGNLRAACAPCHAKRSSEQGNEANRAKGSQRRTSEPHPGLRTD